MYACIQWLYYAYMYVGVYYVLANLYMYEYMYIITTYVGLGILMYLYMYVCMCRFELNCAGTRVCVHMIVCMFVCI